MQGRAASHKYEEYLWCANEDIFAVVDGYQALVLLLPRPHLLDVAVETILSLLRNTCKLTWKKNRRALKPIWPPFLTSFNNKGEEEYSLPCYKRTYLKLYSQSIPILSSVFLWPALQSTAHWHAMFAARVLLPTDLSLIWATAGGAEGGCWVSWVHKHANNNPVLSKLNCCDKWKADI